MTAVAPRPRLVASLSGVAVAIGLSGALTFGYLAVVTRALPAVEYGWFGAYWSLALLVGFGAFLPLEVELARLGHLRGTARPLPAGTVPTLTAQTVASVVVVLACAPLLLPALGDESWLYAWLLGMCLVSAAQFLLRGLLLGQGAYRAHATVMVVDAALRVLLAAGVAVWLPSGSAAAFGWTLPVAVALAHVPLLVVVLRRPPGPVRALGAADRTPGVARAVGQLTVGSLCGQVLLNAAPVLVTAVAAPDERLLADQFVVCFTLVRVPLFVAVPLQSALIPGLTELQRTGDRRALGAALRRLVVGTAGLCAVGALVGLLAGPPLVSLLFGARYALPGADLAVLAVGSALYVGLLVSSQALVAGARHLGSAVAWCAGLAAAAVVFLLVPDLVARAGAAFAVGSGAAFLTATALLLHRPARPAPAAVEAPDALPAVQPGPA